VKEKLTTVLTAVLVLGFLFVLPAWSILREWWMWWGTRLDDPIIDIAAFAIIGVVVWFIVICIKSWIEIRQERRR
jgi:hypothetical protein